MRVLIISLHFPPIGGASSRAVVELCRAMIDAGHEVHVLTVFPVPEHPVYRCSDVQMRRLPGEVRVHRIPMGPINRLIARAMKPQVESAPHRCGIVRGAINRIYQARRMWQPLAIPDASIDWLPGAAFRARAILRSAEFDLVVSLGNPHTCHLAAFIATRGTRCKWVPFYGDSWGLDPGLSGRPKLSGFINRLLEREVLKGAAGVAVCTEAMKTDLAQAYGIDHCRITATPLAFADIDSYEAIHRQPAPGFNLVYTGSIYEALQDPIPLLRAAGAISASELTIWFIGLIPEQYKRAAEILRVNARFLGWCAPDTIIEHQKNATALLIFGHRGGQVMPSKIYEYFAARRPVLSICADEQDLIPPLIHKHGRGVVTANRESDIEQALRKLLDLDRRGCLDSSFDLTLLPEYSAQTIAQHLMNGIIGAAAFEPSRMTIPVTTTHGAV